MNKILLIEDNPDMRENTAEILELAGYEVVTAEHGKRGVKLAHDEQPDLVICDIMMPELDGYGVLHVLSRSPETAGIPFIFLTAKAEKSDFRKGMNLGADDYLTKPFEDVELLDAIEMRKKKWENLKSLNVENEQQLNHFVDEVRAQGALSSLQADREKRTYKAKDLIFEEGHHAHYLYFVNKGRIKTYKTNEDAKEYVEGLHKAGEFLGYNALLKDSPYVDSAMALEDSELVLIPKEDFLALIYNNRDVSHKFVRLLSRDLAEKEEQLLHLAYDTVRKRVADALMRLYDTYQESEEDNFSISLSRDNLASIVGTSKECVIRVLSEFKSDGLLETKQSMIKIMQPEEIRKIRF
ncbi:MAG: response regulator [Bacteroidota bacterium]